MAGDSQLAAAAERLRQRALDHEAALGDGVTDIQPWDADWLRQQIAECRATADLLDAIQECEDHADTDLPAALWLPMAKHRHRAANTLAAAILDTQEDIHGQ